MPRAMFVMKAKKDDVSIVVDHDASANGVRRYLTWDGEPRQVFSDSFKDDLRSGDLVPCDEETARRAGLKFDPQAVEQIKAEVAEDAKKAAEAIAAAKAEAAKKAEEAKKDEAAKQLAAEKAAKAAKKEQ